MFVPRLYRRSGWYSKFRMNAEFVSQDAEYVSCMMPLQIAHGDFSVLR